MYFPKINVFVLICRTLGVLRPANWARLHGTFLRPGILESLNKITVGRFKAVHECFRLHCVILHGFWLKTQQRCSGSPARASDFFFFNADSQVFASRRELSQSGLLAILHSLCTAPHYRLLLLDPMTCTIGPAYAHHSKHVLSYCCLAVN